MFTNGLATIQTDELHSYEDGINVLGESMLLDFGSPKQIERAMVTAKRLEWLTGINAAGHRHVRSNYFNGAKMAEGGVWGWSKEASYMVFHPALSLVLFNGAPETRKMILELADGISRALQAGAGRQTISAYRGQLQDRRRQANRHAAVVHSVGGVSLDRRSEVREAVCGCAGRIAAARSTTTRSTCSTCARRETDPLICRGQQLNRSQRARLAAGMAGHRRHVVPRTRFTLRRFRPRTTASSSTPKGSLWIDRIYFNNGELQRSRLGGVALMRNYCYPGNAVSWRFDAPANDQSVAILVPEATPDHVKIIAYNLDPVPVKAHMTGWEIDPGQVDDDAGHAEGNWKRTAGTDASTAGRDHEDGPVRAQQGCWTSPLRRAPRR